MNNDPLFSVIVPTHNRRASLQETLHSLFQQDYQNFEIIVVNDGSTDDTDGYLSQVALEGKIVYLKQHNRGPASARNHGLSVAKGEYIAFTDDDCLVPLDWLRRFADYFERTRVDVVGGMVRNCVQRNIFSEVSQEMSNHFVKFLSRANQVTTFLTSNNVAYHSESVRKAGGFSDRFRHPGGEERALHHVILRQGGKVVMLPDQIVDHYHVLTLRSFLKQHYYYGRGSFILHRIISKELSHSPNPIPLSAYSSLMMSLFHNSLLKGVKKMIFFALAEISVFFGFLVESLSSHHQVEVSMTARPR